METNLINMLALTGYFIDVVLMFVLIGILVVKYFDTRFKANKKGILAFILVFVLADTFLILDIVRLFFKGGVVLETLATILTLLALLTLIVAAIINWKFLNKPLFTVMMFVGFITLVGLGFVRMIFGVFSEFANILAILAMSILTYYFVVNFLIDASYKKSKNVACKEKKCWINWTYSVLGLVIVLGILIVAFFTYSNSQRLSGELNIYNWEDYFAPGVIEGFEKETGVKVNLYEFDDEYLMLDELKRGYGEYDLIVSSDAILDELIESQMLQKIDKKKISNLKTINPSCDVLDEYEEYSSPYLWGTTGIIINTKFVPEDTDSWRVLWDEKYSGKMYMLDNPDETFGAAAKYLGFNLVPTKESDLRKVYSVLNKQKPLMKEYGDYIKYSDLWASEDIWLAQGYSGEAQLIGVEGLKYILPKEGGSRWVEFFTIPRNAKNKVAAQAFINYVQEVHVNAQIAEYQWSGTCNQGADVLIDKELLNDESVNPIGITANKLDFFSDYQMSEDIKTLREELWQELMVK